MDRSRRRLVTGFRSTRRTTGLPIPKTLRMFRPSELLLIDSSALSTQTVSCTCFWRCWPTCGTKRSLAGRSGLASNVGAIDLVVSDDGRGTQLVHHPDTGVILVKPIMASADLRYFGRDDAPLLASGAKRSGISVVNALSSALTHSSLRQGSIASVQRCERSSLWGHPRRWPITPEALVSSFVPTTKSSETCPPPMSPHD